MIEVDELHELYGAAMESIPAAERALVESYFLNEGGNSISAVPEARTARTL